MRRDARGRVWNDYDVMVKGSQRKTDAIVQPGAQSAAYDEAQRLANSDGRPRWVKGRDGGRSYGIFDDHPGGCAVQIDPATTPKGT